MKTIIYSLLLLGLFSICSCSVEKRLYNKGYSVSWNKKFKGSENQPEKNPENAIAQADKEVIQDKPQIVVQEQAPIGVSHQSDANNDLTLVSTPEKVSPGKSTVQSEKQKSFHPKAIVKKLKESKVIKRDGGGSHPHRAITLLIFALIFVLLGFLFAANFGALGLVFAAIFFVGAALMLIFSIIYFIL